MKSFVKNCSCAAVISLFLGFGASVSAHPGPLGHTHFPDEVDEFDQVAITSPEKSAINYYGLGGVVALMLVGGCLVYRFSQKEGGVLRDAI